MKDYWHSKADVSTFTLHIAEPGNPMQPLKRLVRSVTGARALIHIWSDLLCSER